MTGIVRILLTVTLKMLITFNIFKAVLVVIVYGVMVMHGLCIRCQEVQNIVIIKALHVLMRVRCIVSNGFISVESETCPLCKNEDDSIVPVNNLSCDQDKL